MNSKTAHRYMECLPKYNDKMDDAAILEFSPFQTSIREALDILHNDYYSNFYATIYSILVLRVVVRPKSQLLKLLISNPNKFLLSYYNII